MSKTTVRPPGPLLIERRPDGRRRLLRVLRIQVSGENDEREIPRGFETDFSSLPWGTRWVVDWSRVDVAGVVHDYLYSEDQRDCPRLRADLIWFKVARSGCQRANWVQAGICFAALVLFGWMCKATGPGCSRRHKWCWGVSEGAGAAFLLWLVCHIRTFGLGVCGVVRLLL